MQNQVVSGLADFTVNRKGASRKTLADDVLGDVLGIELEGLRPQQMPVPPRKKAARKKVARASRRKGERPRKGERRAVKKSKR